MICGVLSLIHARPTLAASGIHLNVVAFVSVTFWAMRFLRVLGYRPDTPQSIQAMRNRL